MSPKTDVSAERKQQIYQAALTCFNRQGYHQTTMDDIAVESGLSKGTLYWYFDSKKALFISLSQDFLAAMGREWESIAADETMSAKKKLQSCLDTIRVQFGTMVDFFGVVLEAWALTHFEEDVQTFSRESYLPYLRYMDQILEEGIANGEFEVSDVQATSAVILTMFDGLTLGVGSGIIDYHPDVLFDAAEAMVLRALKAEV